jgi:hypothetical protein
MAAFHITYRIAAMDFQSAGPSVIKSIKQRDLLNTWLRLYARQNQVPRVVDYQPERIADELPDLVYYTVDNAHQPPRLIIESHGTRMSDAFGNTGRGRYLDEYLGANRAPVILPVYHQCIRCGLPTYTISMVDDINGRSVAYERMLMPFSEGGGISHIIASLKAISEDGSFEIRNLLRGHQALPMPTLSVVIDTSLFHRKPSRIADGDVIEFN